MADIFHDFPIKTPMNLVYAAAEGTEFTLWFGPAYDWRARVTNAIFPSAFELQMTKADTDWLGTRVGFRIEARDAMTQAMYLRILRRQLEYGEQVPHEMRLDA